MRRWFAPALIAATVLFSMFVYRQLPERMPVHWGWHGQVDRYGSRVEGAFMLPALMLLIWLLLRFLPRIDPRRENYAKFADTYELLINSIITCALIGSVGLLVTALPSHKEEPLRLLGSGAALWFTNVLVFALWYWRLDGGGPAVRHERKQFGSRSFLFPQMQVEKQERGRFGCEGWRPGRTRRWS